MSLGKPSGITPSVAIRRVGAVVGRRRRSLPRRRRRRARAARARPRVAAGCGGRGRLVAPAGQCERAQRDRGDERRGRAAREESIGLEDRLSHSPSWVDGRRSYPARACAARRARLVSARRKPIRETNAHARAPAAASFALIAAIAALARCWPLRARATSTADQNGSAARRSPGVLYAIGASLGEPGEAVRARRGRGARGGARPGRQRAAASPTRARATSARAERSDEFHERRLQELARREELAGAPAARARRCASPAR